MSSTYGENLKLSIFGQSHGAAIGMTLDGIPAGLPVDLEALQVFLNRRAPGQNSWSTPRKEGDRPEFLSGILDGFTCGAPIAHHSQQQHPIRGLRKPEGLSPPRSCRLHRTGQIRWLSGCCRRRTFFRAAHRSFVHCRGIVQAVACRAGYSHCCQNHRDWRRSG